MDQLRFAAFGAGFWATYQLAGWRQAGGASCTAIYNRSRETVWRLARDGIECDLAAGPDGGHHRQCRLLRAVAESQS
ncbi:MAG: hypothetical protein U5J83_07365 [Bryobacterales bacterium]|nr:hypothetical protein [Bryobacterales bacterium]